VRGEDDKPIKTRVMLANEKIGQFEARRTFLLSNFHARGDIGNNCAFEIHSFVDIWMLPRFAAHDELGARIDSVLD